MSADVGREAAVAEKRSQDPGASEELARRIDARVEEMIDAGAYLILATARNERLAKAIHDDVHQRLKQDGLLPARAEGVQEARWVLLDYLDCVLHVFVPEARAHYRLEQLWGEAPRLEL